jgi:hypothetical protein
MKTLFTVLLNTSVFNQIIVVAVLLSLTVGCETRPTTENLPQSSLFKIDNTELGVVNMTKSEANVNDYDPEKPNFSQVRLDLNTEMAGVLTNNRLVTRVSSQNLLPCSQPNQPQTSGFLIYRELA